MDYFDKLRAKRSRPLSTEAEIQASLTLEADEVFEDAKGKSLEHLDGRVSRTLERFEKSIVGRSLWRLLPGVRALHAHCVAENRTVPERGVQLDNDARVFSVPVANPAVIMLGVERGDSRYVTVVHTGARDGDEEIKVMVGRWKPDAADHLARLPNPLPADIAEALRLARPLSKYADIGSSSTIEALARELAERGDQLPYRTDLTDATFYESEGARVPTMYFSANRVAVGTWIDYTRVMAPVAEKAAPLEQGLFHTDGNEREPMAALALDGGFFGPASTRLTRGFRGRMLVNHLHAVADTFRDIHDTLSSHGYVWGEKSLVHGDADMRSFAVPVQDPSKRAFVHHSLFSNGPTSRYLVQLTMSDAQTVSGVEVHPLYKPAASERANWTHERNVDGLMRLARNCGEFADPEASPPRLSQAETIRRLRAGEPLPPAALAADLANNVAAEPTWIGEAIAYYMMTDLIGATHQALQQLASGGQGNSLLEDSNEFGDEEAGECAPGATPRRRR